MDYTKSNLNIEKKEKKIQINLFNKIKLYYIPPFFEINSNATKKSIIKDTKIMTGFEKYNFSKIKKNSFNYYLNIFFVDLYM